MQVPGSAAIDGLPLVNVDYTLSGGILNTLPTNLQNVIVQKRILLPRRYTAGSLLIDDNNWDWRDIGKLWLPSEMEVYGTNIWGNNLSPNQGYATGGFQQYPIFANNMRRVKGAGDGGARSYWWLLSVGGGASSTCCGVGYYGSASYCYYDASYATIRAPLCFRIA